MIGEVTFLTAALIVSAPRASPTVARMASQSAVTYGQKYGLDPVLLGAIMLHESGLNPHALRIDRRGCDVGIAQIRFSPCPHPKRRKMSIWRSVRAASRLLSRRRAKCESGGWPERYCGVHWVQTYNGKSKGYAERVLAVYERLKGIIRAIRVESLK